MSSTLQASTSLASRTKAKKKKCSFVIPSLPQSGSTPNHIKTRLRLRHEQKYVSSSFSPNLPVSKEEDYDEVDHNDNHGDDDDSNSIDKENKQQEALNEFVMSGFNKEEESGSFGSSTVLLSPVDMNKQQRLNSLTDIKNRLKSTVKKKKKKKTFTDNSIDDTATSVFVKENKDLHHIRHRIAMHNALSTAKKKKTPGERSIFFKDDFDDDHESLSQEKAEEQRNCVAITDIISDRHYPYSPPAASVTSVTSGIAEKKQDHSDGFSIRRPKEVFSLSSSSSSSSSLNDNHINKIESENEEKGQQKRLRISPDTHSNHENNQQLKEIPKSLKQQQEEGTLIPLEFQSFMQNTLCISDSSDSLDQMQIPSKNIMTKIQQMFYDMKLNHMNELHRLELEKEQMRSHYEKEIYILKREKQEMEDLVSGHILDCSTAFVLDGDVTMSKEEKEEGCDEEYDETEECDEESEFENQEEISSSFQLPDQHELCHNNTSESVIFDFDDSQQSLLSTTEDVSSNNEFLVDRQKIQRAQSNESRKKKHSSCFKELFDDMNLNDQSFTHNEESNISTSSSFSSPPEASIGSIFLEDVTEGGAQGKAKATREKKRNNNISTTPIRRSARIRRKSQEGGEL